MFKDLSLKQVYDSENDDLLSQFYIPVLKNSTIYKRITGFFSSSSLLIAAEGIAYFFSNNGSYQLISGVILSEKDYEAFVKGNVEKNELIEKMSFDPLSLENEIEKDHLRILSWLIAKGKLEIKIAVMPTTSSGLFHEKIGIFEDLSGNRISFSGSINESAAGWINNLEEFKVFRSWEAAEKGYLKSDYDKFSNYWKNTTNNFSIIDLPAAIKQNLLKIKPEDTEVIEIVERIKSKKINSKRELRPYQEEAIKKWIDNKCKGIFEMATGTGKTITALGAINKIYEQKAEYCVILVVPYQHLVTQWIKEIKNELKNGIIVEAHGNAPGWRKKMTQFLSDYNDNFIKNLVIVTLYDTLSSDDFMKIFNNYFNQRRTYIIIADEVHNFGAPEYSLGMFDYIDKRLGLSATPTRWFDQEGTQKLINYFDKTVFVYNMKMAIANKILTPYHYFPIFVQMTNDEFEEYLEISKKIIKNINKSNFENNDYLKILMLKRSKIIKNNKTKMEYFASLIQELLSKNKIDHLLVYCDSGGQLVEAQGIINKFRVVSHKFTENESMKEREIILSDFDKGTYDCLVAVKCLDEGVDIPSTKTAIILASSTNPREYIQRRGRILRKHPGKNIATIFDFIVLPPEKIEDTPLYPMEQYILKKELDRTQEFLDTASNKAFIINSLSDIMLKYRVFLD